jgi:hypothetical protein
MHTERHAPAMHDWPAMQATAQPPQLLWSVIVSTHVPLQNVVPVPQIDAHAPAVHDWPAGHARPQAPQWLLSLDVSTQAPPHIVRGAVHIEAGRHVPVTHT